MISKINTKFVQYIILNLESILKWSIETTRFHNNNNHIMLSVEKWLLFDVWIILFGREFSMTDRRANSLVRIRPQCTQCSTLSYWIRPFRRREQEQGILAMIHPHYIRIESVCQWFHLVVTFLFSKRGFSLFHPKHHPSLTWWLSRHQYPEEQPWVKQFWSRHCDCWDSPAVEFLPSSVCLLI